MSDAEDLRLEVGLPLDPEDFIRRGCPECGREFKRWVDQFGGVEEDDRAAESAEPENFCPYCRHQGSDWFTGAQRDYLTVKASEAVGEQLLSRFGGGAGAVRVEVETGSSGVEPPCEPGDMERRDPSCHPGEPLKVLDGWNGPVHCCVCGEPL